MGGRRYVPAMKLPARSLILLLVAVGLAGLFVRLGLWQLSRRAERLDRNAAVAERSVLAALDWTRPGSVPPDTSGMTWRRVRVSGRYDREREIVLRGRTLDGRPGVESLTPLMVGDAAVLVIRGWLPAADAMRPDLPSGWPPDWDDEGSVTLSGTVVPPAPGRAGQPISLDMGGGERLILAGADPEVVAEHLPYGLLPYVIRADAGQPRAATLDQPRPSEPGSGPHLSYAIQWFAFAAIAIGGTGILLLREQRT
ncbi:MAG: SURF1 family protein [Gemmatimonadota bacterium]|nr:SURF1 family protein [Gemmatimonadota bacterium]